MDIKSLSPRELLLNPINLLHQVFTALLPGVLVLVLLMLKHSPLIPAALGTASMLGYKSIIALALLIAFILGRVVQSGMLLVFKIASWVIALIKESSAERATKRESEKATDQRGGAELEAEPATGILTLQTLDASDTSAKEDPTTAQPLKLTAEQETARHFFTALLMGTVVAKDGSAFDSWRAGRAHLGLAMMSGFVLILASFYPGDGLRLYEFGGGVLLVVSAIIEALELERLRIEAIGNAVGQVIASHSVEENTEILQMTARVLPVIMKHVNPTPDENKPAEIVAEIAETSAPARPAQAERNQRKRHRR
jgi:uncharacterized membrane protein